MLVPETDSEFKESDVKLDSLPHAKRENPFKYTELELAENDIWLKQLMELYPHTPRYFHELAINYYRSVGAEEIERIANSGGWDEKKETEKEEKEEEKD